MAPITLPLSPLPGVVTDNTTFDDEQRVYDMEGLRWREGRLETIGGWSAQTAITGVTTPNVFGWSKAGVFTTAYGTVSGLFTATGTGTVTQRRPAVFSSVNQWSMAAWGDYLIAAPSGQAYQPMVWTGGATAAYIATAPASCTVLLVTPQRQVMCLGTNQESGGAFNGLCIRWSDIEDYTDWTTAVDSNAGEHVLDGASPIRAAAVIGDDLAILTGDALWHGRFVGLIDQTYEFKKIAETIGPSHKNLICVMQGTVYWWGTDLKMRRWAPGSPIDEMACPVTREMRTNYYTSAIQYSFMAALYREEEVWLFYGDTRDGMIVSASRYIAFCRKETELAQRPVWIKGVMTRSAMIDAGDNGVIMVDSGGQVYLHEITGTAPSTGWAFYIGDFYLDKAKRRMFISRFTPDFEIQGASIAFAVSLRDLPRGGTNGKGPYTVTIGATKYDFRASGRIASILIETLASSSLSTFRMGKPTLDITPMGEG